jgi:hypothetical protein
VSPNFFLNKTQHRPRRNKAKLSDEIPNLRRDPFSATMSHIENYDMKASSVSLAVAWAGFASLLSFGSHTHRVFLKEWRDFIALHEIYTYLKLPKLF